MYFCIASAAVTAHSAVGASCTPRALQRVTFAGISGRSASTPAHKPCTALTPFRCGHWRWEVAGDSEAIQKSTAMSPAGSAGMRTSSNPRKPPSRAESIEASMPTRILSRTPRAGAEDEIDRHADQHDHHPGDGGGGAIDEQDA